MSSRQYPSRGRVRAVLFDLDGTLVEFKFKVKESRLALIDYLRHAGFKVPNVGEKTRTQQILDSAFEEWSSSKALRESRGFEAYQSDISNVLDEFEFESFREARPHPGSLPTLKRLRQEKFKTALVTNSGRKPVDFMLGNLGFLPYLGLVITRNEMKRLKPDPWGLLEAAKKLKVSPDEAIYVGDSVIDIEAARSAHMRSVALTSGIYDSKILSESNPDYMIDRIEDLERIVLG